MAGKCVSPILLMIRISTRIHSPPRGKRAEILTSSDILRLAYAWAFGEMWNMQNMRDKKHMHSRNSLKYKRFKSLSPCPRDFRDISFYGGVVQGSTQRTLPWTPSQTARMLAFSYLPNTVSFIYQMGILNLSIVGFSAVTLVSSTFKSPGFLGG